MRVAPFAEVALDFVFVLALVLVAVVRGMSAISAKVIGAHRPLTLGTQVKQCAQGCLACWTKPKRVRQPQSLAVTRAGGGGAITPSLFYASREFWFIRILLRACALHAQAVIIQEIAPVARQPGGRTSSHSRRATTHVHVTSFSIRRCGQKGHARADDENLAQTGQDCCSARSA